MDKKNFFSKNLALARKLKGYHQYEVADRIGVRPNTISNYEKGVSEPNYETLGKLMEVFEVTADDLLFAQPKDFRSVYIKAVSPSSIGKNRKKKKFLKKGVVYHHLPACVLPTKGIFEFMSSYQHPFNTMVEAGSAGQKANVPQIEAMEVR